VQTLASGTVAGVVYAIDLVAFHECFPDTLSESAYLKCFMKLVRDAVVNAMTFNQREPASTITKIEYIFDNRPEVEFSAARLYSAAINEPEWKPASLMATKLSFECRTNPRIQMGDLLAREGMKDLDRVVGPVRFPERRSKIALAGSDHFRFFQIGRNEFQRERAEWSTLEKDGVSEAAYHRWLNERGAQDTWDNRVRFREHIDKRRFT
jgi:hypothetical protein